MILVNRPDAVALAVFWPVNAWARMVVVKPRWRSSNPDGVIPLRCGPRFPDGIAYGQAEVLRLLAAWTVGKGE